VAFLVFVTNDAARDMEEIDRYICTHDSPSKADQVLDQIEMALASLTQSPNRVAYPKELLELGSANTGKSSSNPTESSTGYWATPCMSC